MRRVRQVGIALIGLAALAAAGCNIVAPAFYLIHGPEKVKRLYTLDKERTAVVFIDDRANRIPRRATRLAMAEQAQDDLLKARAVKDMVSAQSAMLAAGRDTQGQPISVTEIGRAVQAQVVIYATVDEFSLTPDGQTFAPIARLRVKVIDAENDKRLWPEKPEGHTLTIRASPKTQELPTSTAARFAAEDDLARRAGQELAWIFVTHERPHGPRGVE